MANFSDPILAHRLKSLIANVDHSRTQMLTQLMGDQQRDVFKECHFPTTLTQYDYRDMFDRDATAARVAEILPEECWQVHPSVFESRKNRATPWENAWDEFCNSLRGEACWYQDEEGAPLWDILRRVDTRSRIGAFGLLLLGFDDGKSLDQPVDGVVTTEPRSLTKNQRYAYRSIPTPELPWLGRDGDIAVYNEGVQKAQEFVQSMVTKGTDAQYFGLQMGPSEYLATEPAKEPRKLLYMRPYDETLLQVIQYEANAHNPRFGRPVRYRVTLNDPREFHGGIGLTYSTVTVHWSRVIHVTDDLGSSEVFHIPSMRPVFNHLLCLQRIYGADGELFWRNAVMKLFFETHPALGGDVKVNRTQMREDVDKMLNGLQQWMLTTGLSAKSIAPSVVDPGPHVDTHKKAICNKIACPMRVFDGSERGELASSQDDTRWDDRMRKREIVHCTGHIIIPLADRLIATNVLPVPGQGLAPSKQREAMRNRGHTTRNDDGTQTANAGGYSIEWPDLASMSKADKAGVMSQRTAAWAQYQSSGMEGTVPVKTYMTEFDSMTEEQADAIIADAAKAEEDKQATHEDTADEHGYVPAPPPGFVAPPAPPKSPTENVDYTRDAHGRFASTGALADAAQRHAEENTPESLAAFMEALSDHTRTHAEEEERVSKPAPTPKLPKPVRLAPGQVSKDAAALKSHLDRGMELGDDTLSHSEADAFTERIRGHSKVDIASILSHAGEDARGSKDEMLKQVRRKLTQWKDARDSIQV